MIDKKQFCTYKKCGKPGAIPRSTVNGQYICDDFYRIKLDLIKLAEKRRRQNPEHLLNAREYDSKWKKKLYRENKNNPDFMEKRRVKNRKYLKEYREQGLYRFKSLKDNARKVGGTNLTSEELRNIIDNEKCYISGIALKDAAIYQKVSYFLDRIGKIENGGDGISGGNYNKDNVLPALFAFNQLREALKLTPEEMKTLFEPIRNSEDPEILLLLEKVMKYSFKKNHQGKKK